MINAFLFFFGDNKTTPLLFELDLIHLRSRLLITTIPSKMYVFDEDGINVTLQAAAEIIVDSMNQLSTTGIHVHNVQGDEVPWYHFVRFHPKIFSPKNHTKKNYLGN